MKLPIKNKLVAIAGSILLLSSYSNPNQVKATEFEGETILDEYQ